MNHVKSVCFCWNVYPFRFAMCRVNACPQLPSSCTDSRMANTVCVCVCVCVWHVSVKVCLQLCVCGPAGGRGGVIKLHCTLVDGQVEVSSVQGHCHHMLTYGQPGGTQPSFTRLKLGQPLHREKQETFAQHGTGCHGYTHPPC